jgi:hypothetical protein
MLAAIVLFAVNGLYQHRSWWKKGGQETVWEDVDAITSLPSTTSTHSGFGRSFQVGHVLGGGGRGGGYTPTPSGGGEGRLDECCSF